MLVAYYRGNWDPPGKVVLGQEILHMLLFGFGFFPMRLSL